MKTRLLFPVLLLFVTLAGGCVTNGRRVVLKEFQANATASPSSPLHGKSVYVAHFSYEPYFGRTRPAEEPQESKDLDFVEMTDDQQKLWDAQYIALRPALKEEKQTRIGNLRNGYGFVMSHIYNLNDPGDWLKQVVELEVQARGATLAPSPEAADLVIGGDIVWLKIDMYLFHTADFYVNFTLTPRGKPTATHPINTTGKQLAVSTTSYESYQSLRRALQKTMLILLGDIEQSLQP